MDGTNNEFGRTNTNVVRLYQVLALEPVAQMAYYDPGVGTIGHPGAITRLTQKFTQALGLAFGLGVTQNVIDAYSFLMSQYGDGDRILIFGFSRGALEARALAGLLYRCGLLKPELATLVPYAVRIFRMTGNEAVAAQFQATFSRAVRIRFLGLWDTVTSFGNVWSPIAWPNTTNNPGVDIVRHALALDERRAFFRQNRWARGDSTLRQDVKERWFSGVHCDVGGGYPVEESSLWKVSFAWMVDEATHAGLRIDAACFSQVMATPDQSSAPATDSWSSPPHESMAGLRPLWYFAELIPRRRYVGKGSAGKDHYKWLWPIWHWFVPWLFDLGRMGRARAIGRARELRVGDHVHRSVLERFVDDPTYRPDPLLRISLTLEVASQVLSSQQESYEIRAPVIASGAAG